MSDSPSAMASSSAWATRLARAEVFRALRTIPVLLELGRNMDELAPEARLLDYVNPMAANCWAFDKATGRPRGAVP